jgi:two-component system phosphate regulon sensor histidine kinase PhoR
MWLKKLTWQLFVGYLCIMIMPLIVASWYTSRLFRNSFVDQMVLSEKKSAFLLGNDVAGLLAKNDQGGVDSLCKKLSRDIGMRITVVIPSGKVIGDSDRDPDSMENHAYRPEIMTALKGGVGSSQRFSTTLHKKMLYVATPVMKHGALCAVIRTSVPLDTVSAEIHAYYRKIVLAALFLAIVASLLSFILARRIIVPVQELEEGAKRFSRGEFSEKIHLPGIDELKNLAMALNEMAAQLHARIQTITAQKNEQEAILASMTEAVIAVDSAERVLSVNGAAAELFQVDRALAPGKFLGEIIRNSAVQQFTARVLASVSPIEEDLTLSPLLGDERHDLILQVHGSVLHDADNNPSGAVLVASDVTRLRQLENIRKEFVANVSHELRTPLTAIKGFVETLQNGALESKEDTARFLGIIAAQVDRLGVLVDDLLTLARIEREEEEEAIVLEERPLMPIVNAAIRDYAAAAAVKGISVEVSGEATVSTRVNAAMLEQAVGNLIDNAIKYSEPGKRIEIMVSRENADAIIRVNDQGIGIPHEHIDRIFERFYRVDKARSRKAGGTGLGLSIVKHIAALHNGRVSVISFPGEGSAFSIMLPLSPTTGGSNDRG